MKTTRTIAIALIAAFGTAQLAGCASNPTSRSTGRVFDDAAITAKVKLALARDRDVPSHDVNVTTYRGMVELSGFVQDEKVAQKAADDARNVAGVSQVYNDLHIVPRS